MPDYVIFSDTFNRSAGLVDQDWVDTSSQYYTSGSAMYHGDNGANHIWHELDETEDYAVSIHTLPGWASGSGRSGTLLIRGDAANGTTYYKLTFKYYTTSTTGWLTIHKRTGGGDTLLASHDGNFASTEFTLKFEAVGTNISVYVDGTLELSVSDDAIASGAWFGIRNYINAHNYIDSVTVTSPNEPPGTPTLTASPPSVISNHPGYISLHTTATNWTPGIPGTPEFTVDHGSIISQQVWLSNFASVLLDPGPYVGTIQLSDPLNGSQVSIESYDSTTYDAILYDILAAVLTNMGLLWIIQELFSGGGGGGGGDCEEVLEVLGTPPEGSSVLGELAAIWNELQDIQAWYGVPETPADTLYDRIEAINSALADLAIDMGDLTSSGTYSLQSVQDALENKIDDDVGAIGSDIASLSNTLSNHHTVITEQLSAIRTAGLLTLQSIIDSINALDPATSTDVANARNDIMGDPATSIAQVAALVVVIPTNPITSLQPVLDSIEDAVETLGDEHTAILQAIDAIPDPPNVDLQPVLDAIAAIPTPPLWPADGNVTWGDEYPLTDGMVITGPMHGLRVTITAVTPGTGRYVFGLYSSWVNAGAVAFVTASGMFERAQGLSWGDQVVVPTTMAKAGSAIIRLSRITSGTVRAWSIA